MRQALDIERVIVAFSNDPDERTLELVRSLPDLDVQIDIVPRLFDVVGPSARSTLSRACRWSASRRCICRARRLLKRTMDVVLAATGLLVLPPFFLVRRRARSSSTARALSSSARCGSERGEPFRIFKFRTMVGDAEERKASSST